MFTDENVFDCSMFAENVDNDVLEGVANQCDEIGFRGLSNVRLPYNMAISFSQGRGALYKQLYSFAMNTALAKKTKFASEHIRMIEETLTATSNFYTFYSRLKYVVNVFAKNPGFVNKAVYGLYASDEI